MGVKINNVIAFPKDFPPVTTGVLLLERNMLITGHENGFLVKWDMRDGSYQILFKSDSAVTTISYSGSNRIAIGYYSGGLYVLELDDGHHMKTLREPKYSVNSRVWRALWHNSNNLLLTSTYGEITPFRESDGKWEENHMGLKGHFHSVFGIDSISGKYVATGDYKGNILLWEFKNNEFDIVDRVGIVGKIQNICWHDEECFAAITRTGKIYIIERESKKDTNWQTVVEVDIADNAGVCVDITEDGNTVFAGTRGELIQFDLDSYQSETISITNVKGVFSSGNQIYVLTNEGLHVFEKRPVEIKRELISYKFMKISLLGHTGTGKTTFCNRILYGNIDNIYSTFGKRIFNWRLTGEDIQRRIIFHDHGGQETVLDTFIPFIIDSDMILIFYKQTDKATFNRSLDILKEIREKVSKNVPVYFIQTFIDHDLDDIPHEVLKSLIDNERIIDFVKVSPKDNIGFDEFESRILKRIDWDRARTMIQSPYIEGISRTLSALHNKGYPVVLFDVFKQTYQEMIGKTISERHLRFLLEDYTNQGIIEYYPDISELIILDDETFNKMRTNIPIFADHMEGIVSFEDLKKKFDKEVFLAMLDEMYLQSGIAIKNGDLRIFPHKLSEKPLEIPAEYKDYLAGQEPSEIFVNYQKIEIGRLIELLSELHLQCVGVTKNEGLFAWEKNAYVYYFIQEEHKGIFEKYIKFNYFVGGEKEKTKERLTRGFFEAVERVYGPRIDITNKESKKNVKENYEFDVALSFAGEQREYVEQVANILERKGLEVFYDGFKQSQLWGKNLIEYFQEVYYSRSKFCIMFISSDYLRKMWPVHERRSATTRDLEQFGEYILPVIFEDVDVPGLDKYKGYLDARKLGPEDIAKAFLEKLKA
jgi:GTPase SAR1 family protein